MALVEAAASLFGSSDSGSELDFLTAPEGPNSASLSPAGAGAAADELFASQDSSSLFDVNDDSAAASSLFDTSGEAGTQTHEQNEAHLAQSETYQPHTAYGHSQDAQSSYDYNEGGYANYVEGWYDEAGQWHSNEQQEGPPVTTAQTGANASLNPPEMSQGNAGTSSYGSYGSRSQYNVQTGNSTTMYGHQASYEPHSSSARSTYEPYNPAVPSEQSQTNTYGYTPTTSSYDPYKPTGITPSQTTSSPYAATTLSPYDPYNAYKPAASNSRSPSATAPPPPPPALSQSNTFTSSGSLIPPPSVIDTSKPPLSPYRPSTANAYDPPLPAIKPKKSFTVAAFQHQSSSYSPHVTSSTPPPPAARKMSSPPRANPLLPSGPPPPPRSSMYSPPRASTVSYAQSSPVTAERSNSPYDPPPSRQYEPSRSYSPASQDYSRPETNGRHTSPTRYTNPVVQEQLAYSSQYVRHDTNGSQYNLMSQHEVNAQFISTKTTAAVTTQTGVYHQGVAEQAGQFAYSPGQEINDAEAAELGTTSRPTSSHSSTSRRGVSQSPVSERRAHMSPDVPVHSGGTQRTASPGSESGRSHHGSVGRSSPLNNRARTSFIGQSFSALDEQSSQHGEPYSFMMRTSLERISSPGAGSVGSHVNHSGLVPPSPNLYEDRNAVDLSSDTTSVNDRSASPATSALYDPYKPKLSDASPQKLPAESPLPASQATSDPYSPSSQYVPSSRYAPSQSSYGSPELRERSMSNISSFSVSSSTSYDPYAPSGQFINRQEPLAYGTNSYAVPPAGSFAAVGRTSLESMSYSPPPITGPYAPSPSLLGTNDPLGRANAKVPVISFGFGGKLVTCFHSPPTLDTGFDVALSSRKCTDVHIRPLHKAIPESALSVSSASYPGPLFGDPGSPVTTLARATVSATAKSKTKKAKVLAYLAERAEELERGLGYLAAGSVEKRRADGKLSLVRLLRVLVEYDGQIHGSTAAEAAARAALLPRLANPQDAVGANAFLNAPTGASLATGTFGSAGRNAKPLAEYVIHRSALETLQDFLLRGEKRKAYHYALDERMWAHAMVISSSLDKEAFKEVVSEFIRTELGVKDESRPEVPLTNGLESLRLAYSLYSGQSSIAVQHLLPIKSLSLQAGPSLTLQPPTPVNHMTPLSPNFPPPSLATNISPEILSQWPEYAVMLFSGQMGAESSSALTTLGDYLISNDWVEAAHCCYLLSPQSSPIGGVGAPSVRIVLVGSHSPHRNVLFDADPDSFIFSEIVEFALSLHQPVKGQEAFLGFPHLQAYRLIRALQLAEIGQTSLAKRYCDAITSHASRPSPYLSQLFSDQLRELYNRLNGDPELDKAASWIGGKIAKPSLDSLGGWLEGTLSKFVAGEEASGAPGVGEQLSGDNTAYANAFSRYSNISSTNNSRGASPAPSFVNNGGSYNPLPGRTGSAAGFRSVPSYSPSVRVSPSIEHERPGSARNTPPPRVLSEESGMASFNRTQNLSQVSGHYGSGGHANGHPMGNGSAIHDEGQKPQGGGGWWSAAYGDADNVTPTAHSFSNIDSQASETDSGSGFISLMDNYSSFTPSPSATTFTNKKVDEADDFDDDLGLGNSSTKKKKENAEVDESDDKPVKEEEKKEEHKKLDVKPEMMSSTSWFGRWFSRPASTKPAPVKANLGEETTFYYDKELKRWVNKKAGAELPKPAAPPPPPSRAQTASPSRTMKPTSTGPPPPSPLPPPRRPMSAMDAGSSAPPPRKTLTPVRSHLIPEEGPMGPASAPPTPAVMSSLSAAPPTGRPKSAAKKSMRSRYVDVFQQPS